MSTMVTGRIVFTPRLDQLEIVQSPDPHFLDRGRIPHPQRGEADQQHKADQPGIPEPPLEPTPQGSQPFHAVWVSRRGRPVTADFLHQAVEIGCHLRSCPRTGHWPPRFRRNGSRTPPAASAGPGSTCSNCGIDGDDGVAMTVIVGCSEHVEHAAEDGRTERDDVGTRREIGIDCQLPTVELKLKLSAPPAPVM